MLKYPRALHIFPIEPTPTEDRFIGILCKTSFHQFYNFCIQTIIDQDNSGRGEGVMGWATISWKCCKWPYSAISIQHSLKVFDISLYNIGMETLSGPLIKSRACHSPINNHKHKRTADDCVNPRSIRHSPEKWPKFPNFKR